MEVSGVQREKNIVLHRAAEIELVRSDGAALETDAEELGLHGVEVVLLRDVDGEDLVVGAGEVFSLAAAVHGSVLEAVGDPEIVAGRHAQRFAEGSGDLPGLDAVLDPEFADALVVGGQGEAVRGKGMGEEGGVEIEAESLFLRPVDPGGKVLRADLVARDLLSARVEVDGVQGEFLFSGDELQGELEILSELVDVARFSGIVAGGLDAAREVAVRGLEARDVVALPAVYGDRGLCRLFQSRVYVHAVLAVYAARDFQCFFGVQHDLFLLFRFRSVRGFALFPDQAEESSVRFVPGRGGGCVRLVFFDLKR